MVKKYKPKDSFRMPNGRKLNTQKPKENLNDEHQSTEVKKEEKLTDDQFINTFFQVQKKSSTRPDLPKKFKPVSKLYFPDKHEEDKKAPISANRTNVAVRMGKNRKDGFYFFKNSKPIPTMRGTQSSEDGKKPSVAECEVVSASWAKFLAPDCVPTMRVWYDDDNFEIIGRTSKNIPGFVTNHKHPFKEDDTVIFLNVEDEIAGEITQQRKILVEAVQTLHALLKHRKVKEASLLPGVGYLKGFYNRSITGETGTKLADFLKNFLLCTSDLRFTEHRLIELIKHLSARGEYITKYKNDESHKQELEYIIATLEITKYLSRLTQKTTVPMSVVPVLEELLKKAQDEKIDLSNKNVGQNLEIQLNNKKYSASIESINHYRLIKRQMIIWILRYLGKDTDGHNRNFSPDGWMIDFDMAKLPFTFVFRDSNFSDTLLRKPKENTFIVTAYDLEHFPNIKDADFFYWPNRPTKISDSIFPYVSLIYKNLDNFFKSEHTAVFENLGNQPPAIFVKFWMLLKYALCDEFMYRGIAELHMRDKINFVNKNGEIKDLLTEMTRDEKLRIEDIRNKIVAMPSFQKMLDMHGEYLFMQIKSEFKAQRNKYEEKIKSLEKKGVNKYGEAPDTRAYKKIVDSINLEEIEKRYKEIFIRTAKYHHSAQEQKKNAATGHEPDLSRAFRKSM